MPYPDRAAIEDGALDGFSLALLYLADPVDRFFLQVQGSGRVRLPDGRVVRLAYDGRNGQPYTAIGRVMADRMAVPRSRDDDGDAARLSRPRSGPGRAR